MKEGKKSVSRSQQSIIFVTFSKTLNLSEIQFTFHKKQVDQMTIKIFFPVLYNSWLLSQD